VATFQLKPLEEEETKNYILFRLEKAGWQQTPQFDDDVFNAICTYTQGIPRRINTLCDRVLLFGYLDELSVISLNAVNKVIADIEEEASIVTDEFHDVVALSTSSNINYSDTLSPQMEERIAVLERTVANLRTILSKERVLLRKAILIQLDMDGAYDDLSE
jgi:general secretion pathway protein A